MLAARAFEEDCQDWFGVDTIFGGFNSDGTLMCVLDYDPASMWWGQVSIPAGAIGGVATDPKHQGHGHAGGLMVKTIHLLREQGRCVCPLWPFSFAWYGKFRMVLSRSLGHPQSVAGSGVQDRCYRRNGAPC